MRAVLVIPGLLAFALLMPVSAAIAEPPAHAPAHGYRGKVWRSPKTGPHAPAPAPPPRSGVEVIFDSERGIYVGIGLPDVFFHEGTYYRQHEGRWQVSQTGDGGWRKRRASRIPDLLVSAAVHPKSQPGPAAAAGN